jgi:hypothetical protein
MMPRGDLVARIGNLEIKKKREKKKMINQDLNNIY